MRLFGAVSKGDYPTILSEGVINLRYGHEYLYWGLRTSPADALERARVFEQDVTKKATSSSKLKSPARAIFNTPLILSPLRSIRCCIAMIHTGRCGTSRATFHWLILTQQLRSLVCLCLGRRCCNLASVPAADINYLA